MSSGLWAETEKSLNDTLTAFYSALQCAREAQEASALAHQKAVEAADLALECAEANLRFARKRLLLEEDIDDEKPDREIFRQDRR